MTESAIGEVADDHPDLAHLPLGHRAGIRRLRDWLSLDWRGEKRWLAIPHPDGWLGWPEVVCILSGIDPEASEGKETDRLRFLPGVKAAWGLPAKPDALELESAVRTEVARVAKMIRVLEQKTGVPADLTPAEAIRAALKANLQVPWLAVALADPFCRQFLPEELVPEKGEMPPQMTPQQKGAHVRWEGKTSKDEGKAHAAELVSQGHDRQYIAHALENKFGLKHLTLAYAWISELEIQPKPTPRKKRKT